MTGQGPRSPGPLGARDALVLAILPRPRPDLPDPARLDRREFWTRFDAAAPPSLRWASHLAALIIVGLLPWILAGRSWRRLDEPGRDALLRRAAALPGVDDLLDLAKLLACFAWFDDDGVQDAFRGKAR